MSFRIQGFRNSYLRSGIRHLSFLSLGKGTDPLYAVIHSSYTLSYVDVKRYVRRWVEFVSSTKQFQECAISATQFRNQIPVSKLVSNFAISNLRSVISKLRKFANCTEHIRVDRDISVRSEIYTCSTGQSEEHERTTLTRQLLFFSRISTELAISFIANLENCGH